MLQLSPSWGFGYELPDWQQHDDCGRLAGTVTRSSQKTPVSAVLSGCLHPRWRVDGFRRLLRDLASDQPLIRGHRFFASSAREGLSSIFKGIHLQKDKRGQPAVYRISPGPKPVVYRARTFDDANKRKEALKEPARHLSPPSSRMRKAGRMNAVGVSAFYGAFDLETCVAELRPPVGSILVCCEFEIVRPLVVLDTTRFEAPALQRSMFSRVHDERLMQWRFMQKFAYEISKPILPDDQGLDYIPTQAVAEFLNSQLTVYIDGEETQLDGIIFKSAQRPGGKNVVWLGDAAQVVGASDPMDGDSHEWDLAKGFWLIERTNPALRVKPNASHVRLIDGAKFEHSELSVRPIFQRA